ncbi:cytochrome P450 [Immersiella caudata]|uniref:Cytochrome P450 n=1 Tax=Immersiella caudata TaxID=314043 RepID=A0AA40BXQ4_9PEZI|nr:cytochrome P450 [Immersiella caudata]
MALSDSLPVDPTALWAAGAAVILTCLSAFFTLIKSKATAKHGSKLKVFKVTGNNVVEVLEEAHRQCPEEPFMLSLPGMDMAVLPKSEIETIRSLPETEVSIKKHHYDVFLGEYTYMGTKADEFDNAMRYVLTRNTPTVLASFVAEVEHAVSQNIGPCKDWTKVKPRHAMSRIASLMSGRAFVGLPLSRDEDWVEATVNYTQNVSWAWMILHILPKPIRFLVAPLLPQVRSLKRQRAINEEKLAPLLAAKQKEQNGQNGRSKKAADKSAGTEKSPGGDLVDWFVSQYRHPPSVRELGRDQLLATFASIYNLSNALSYILFDLAATSPEDVEAMRDEVRAVLAESGGVIDKNALVKLRKLDSFAKESQRLSPPSLVNIPRIVTNPQGLKTSTGHLIPAGTRMTINSHAINQDPEVYPDPTRFDPFRFSRLRDLPGNELKFQHASTGLDNINFGHGLWACPGRFFANAEIKVVLAHLLVRYDIENTPGTRQSWQRHYGLAILPDSEAEVLIKARA